MLGWSLDGEGTFTIFVHLGPNPLSHPNLAHLLPSLLLLLPFFSHSSYGLFLYSLINFATSIVADYSYRC